MGASLGDLIIRVGAEVDQFQSAMRGINDELKGLENGVEKTGGSIQATFNEAMQGIADRSSEVRAQFEGITAGAQSLAIAGGELSAAITLPIEEIARRATEAAAETEKLQIVFTTLLGSGNLAGSFVEELHQFAAGSALGLPTIEQGAQRLLAFGFAAKDVTGILRTLNATSTAFGRGEEGVSELIGILGKIEETGSVSGRLVNSLKQFGGITALASGLGVSQEDVLARVKVPEGLDATTGINALLKGWGQAFGDIPQAEMQGFSGMMSNMKNQVTLTLDEIGKVLLPIGKMIVEWARDSQEAIRGLVARFKELPVPVQAAAGSLVAMVAAVGPALLALSSIAFFIPNIVIGMKMLGGAMAAIGEVTGIGAIVGELGVFRFMVGSLAAEEGLASAATYAFSGAFGVVRAAFGSIVGVIGSVITGLTGFISTITGVVAEEGLIAGIGAAFTSMAGIVEGAVGALVGAFTLSTGGIALLVVGAIVALTALVTWIFTHWAGVKAAVAQVWDGLGDLWHATLGAALDWVMGKFEWLITTSKPLWSGFADGIKEIWGAIASYITSVWADLKQDVFDPMMRWLEKIPGIKKIEGAGAAFSKGEEDKKDQDTIAAARQGLHLTGEKAPQIMSEHDADLEKHRVKVEQAAKDLGDLRLEYEKGKQSAEQLNEATKAFWAVYNEPLPIRGDLGGKAGKEGMDRSAIDALAAEHTHEEAGFSRERSVIEHDFQLSKPAPGEFDPFTSSVFDTTAALKRRQELDAVAKEELDATNREIDGKMAAYAKMYASQKDGTTKLKDEDVKLNGERTTANDKYEAELLKNKQSEETAFKQIDDRLDADNRRRNEQRLNEEKRMATESLRIDREHVDAQARLAEIGRETSRKFEDAKRQLATQNLDAELDIGGITKQKYLTEKQKLFDAEYEQDRKDLQAERKQLQDNYDAELNDLKAHLAAMQALAAAGDEKAPEEVLRTHGAIQRSEDKFKIENARLNQKGQGIDQTHDINTASIGKQKEQDLFDKSGFKAFENSFASGITGMIEGTKTFRQAWQSMVASMLNTWISSLAQQAAHWVAYKLFELVFHTTVNEGKVASDASAAAQSRAISTSTHLHEVLLHAKSAAAAAFNAVVGIPLIGPILAPIAAAGAYVAVAAFGSVSAERGAVLPNENTIAFLHPKEMVLPSHISEGLQSAISSGGLSGGDNYNFHGDVNYHAAHGERMNVDTFHGLFMAMLRQKNLKMA